MEMSFPTRNLARLPTEEQRDYRAMLAVAISRQASCWTARAMMLSNSVHRRKLSDDAVADRIQYFSSHSEGSSSRAIHSTQPFGPFFPSLGGTDANDAKGKRDVNHSGSTIGKVANLNWVSADLQPEHAGHGISRKI